MATVDELKAFSKGPCSVGFLEVEGDGVTALAVDTFVGLQGVAAGRIARLPGRRVGLDGAPLATGELNARASAMIPR